MPQLTDVEPALVLTSTYLRARETARPFCEKTGCPATPDPLLQEFPAFDPALIEGTMGAERLDASSTQRSGVEDRAAKKSVFPEPIQGFRQPYGASWEDTRTIRVPMSGLTLHLTRRHYEKKR